MPHEYPLQWVRKDLDILLVEFVKKAILDAAAKSSGESASKSGLTGLTAEECLTMKRARSRLLAREEGSSHLNAFGSKSEGCHDSAGISNSAGGDDRELHSIDDLRYQRQGPRERIFSRLQEGAAMSASLKAGGRNHVHARLLQRNCFVYGGCRSNQRDSPAAELIQYLFGGNSINKAECGNPSVQENLYLIFKTNCFVRQISRPCSSYTFNMPFQRSEAAMECFFRRGQGSIVLH